MYVENPSCISWCMYYTACSIWNDLLCFHVAYGDSCLRNPLTYQCLLKHTRNKSRHIQSQTHTPDGHSPSTFALGPRGNRSKLVPPEQGTSGSQVSPCFFFNVFFFKIQYKYGFNLHLYLSDIKWEQDSLCWVTSVGQMGFSGWPTWCNHNAAKIAFF